MSSKYRIIKSTEDNREGNKGGYYWDMDGTLNLPPITSVYISGGTYNYRQIYPTREEAEREAERFMKFYTKFDSYESKQDKCNRGKEKYGSKNQEKYYQPGDEAFIPDPRCKDGNKGDVVSYDKYKMKLKERDEKGGQTGWWAKVLS